MPRKLALPTYEPVAGDLDNPPGITNEPGISFGDTIRGPLVAPDLADPVTKPKKPRADKGTPRKTIEEQVMSKVAALTIEIANMTGHRDALVEDVARIDSEIRTLETEQRRYQAMLDAAEKVTP